MSYIEKAKQNKANADKAAAFDELQRREQQRLNYDAGAKDAYTAVEMEMMRRAQEQAMQRQMQEAYNRDAYQEPRPTTGWGQLEGLAGTVRKAGNAVGDWWTDTMNRVDNIDPLTNEPRK